MGGTRLATISDALPSDVGKSLDPVRSLLDALPVDAPTDQPGPPPRRRWAGRARPADVANLTFDPAAGRFAIKKADGSGSDVRDGGEPASWLQFPDPNVDYEVLVEYTDTTFTTTAGPFQINLTFPASILTIPHLRGARLDVRGMLVEDPANPKVRFHLPRLAVRVERTAAGETSTKLVSATAGTVNAPDFYEFCRMEPEHALVGPGNVFGFAFRTAVLDLSEQTNPPGAARSLPTAWQGLWLPEVRVFVAPNGLEDLALAAGVRDPRSTGLGRVHEPRRQRAGPVAHERRQHGARRHLRGAPDADHAGRGVLRLDGPHGGRRGRGAHRRPTERGRAPLRGDMGRRRSRRLAAVPVPGGGRSHPRCARARAGPPRPAFTRLAAGTGHLAADQPTRLVGAHRGRLRRRARRRRAAPLDRRPSDRQPSRALRARRHGHPRSTSGRRLRRGPRGPSRSMPWRSAP